MRNLILIWTQDNVCNVMSKNQLKVLLLKANFLARSKAWNYLFSLWQYTYILNKQKPKTTSYNPLFWTCNIIKAIYEHIYIAAFYISSIDVISLTKYKGNYFWVCKVFLDLYDTDKYLGDVRKCSIPHTSR